MSTNFPGTSIDSFPTHATGDVIQASYDNNEQDAIVALETKVGVNGSATSSTFDYKLSGVTGSDKAVSKTGTETLTNKTLSTGTKVLLGSDATNDIYYNGGSGVLTRLPVGTALQVLRVNSGATALEYATPAAVVNASSTVAGIVEIATAAEITAGTATGGTGAILAISPDQLALSTPVFNGSALTNVLIPFYQKLPYFSGTSTTFLSQSTTAEIDGSAIYVVSLTTAGNNQLQISRFQRDVTGQYYQTHSITTSARVTSAITQFAAIGVDSTYLYFTASDGGSGGTHKLVSRIAKADLTGLAGLSLSGTEWADGRAGFSDGTNIYIYESSGVYRQYSISGTTITNVTTITYTTA